MKLQVIYIPGLGDSRVRGQSLAVGWWRIWGVEPQLFQMNWADGEAFEPKFNRLLTAIDTAARKGPVALVAASAGATAAMNAFAARPAVITGVVCIAGKINNPQAIGGNYARRNPAFLESAHQGTSALEKLSEVERKRILSIRAMLDPIVPARDSILPGARNKVTWTSGHAATIAAQLVWGAPLLLHFLKQQAKSFNKQV